MNISDKHLYVLVVKVHEQLEHYHRVNFFFRIQLFVFGLFFFTFFFLPKDEEPFDKLVAVLQQNVFGFFFICLIFPLISLFQQMRNLSINSALPLKVGSQESVAMYREILIELIVTLILTCFLAYVFQDGASFISTAYILDLIFHELAESFHESCLVEGRQVQHNWIFKDFNHF